MATPIELETGGTVWKLLVREGDRWLTWRITAGSRSVSPLRIGSTCVLYCVSIVCRRVL